MRKVKIVDVCLKEKLRSIFNGYLVELSEFDKGIKFDKNNTPIYKYYDNYFVDKDRYPFCLEIDSNIAGFALVRKISNYHYEIGEFYICREYRKDGNALFLATCVFDMFKGYFSFSTKANNVRAVKFWSKFVSDFEDVITYKDEDVVNWKVIDNSLKKHNLGLQPLYFEMIKNGSKVYEGWLNDDKRKLMNVGDIISFLKDPQRKESFEAVIVNKFIFSSFKEMVDNLNIKKLGFKKGTKEEIVDIYHQFYSLDDEEKYGVVAFEIEVI